MNKICTKCKNEKEIQHFPRNKRFKTTGFNSICKACCNNYSKTIRNVNIEQYKEVRKKYVLKNIDKVREQACKSAKKRVNEKSKYDIEYRIKNAKKIAQYKKNWEVKNKDNPIYKIKKNLRRRVHHALKGKRKFDKTFNLIGCTPNFFKSYIESQFSEGMSWENYGQWHIDHIIPCYSFNLTKQEEQEKCFHYSNQRPLWSIDNLKRKRSEYNKSTVND